MNPDEAARILSPAELHVLLLASQGIGRRSGSLMLGISEDAWRWRLASARRKIAQHTREQEEAA